MNLLRTAVGASSRIGRQYCRQRRRPEEISLPLHGLHRSRTAQIHQSSYRPSAVQPSSPDDPTEQRSPPSDKVLRLVDEISSLTLLEVYDLTTLLKRRLGMPDMPMMPMMGGFPMMQQGGMGAPAAGAPVEEKKVEEKTQFDVKLEKYDAASKLKVIKEVRVITALGLKESKDMVEQTPVVVKKGVSKEEATAILEKLKAVGATCILE